MNRFILRNLIYTILCFGCSANQQRRTMVIMNSSLPGGYSAKTYLVPYLDHFGFAYDLIDVAKEKIPSTVASYGLVIVAQDFPGVPGFEKQISKYYNHGIGVVSFDQDLFTGDSSGILQPGRIITFDTAHYITALHSLSDTLRLFRETVVRHVKDLRGRPVVLISGMPLVTAFENNGRKIVYWSSMDWMNTRALGPMMGLDDCLWRSLIWAAKKPFVIKGLPPLITMRVDDVAGRGELWSQSPFYWVATANRYGFKPWLGLFIYNLNPGAISELRGYILKGNATAAPHALGRPNRSHNKNLNIKDYADGRSPDLYAGLYYNPSAIPLRVNDYDEFIYFDHTRKVPWNDTEAARGLAAVDRWYEQNRPLPMSKYLIPHFYEIGSNTLEHISVAWGIEYLSLNKEADMPYVDSVPWIRGAPFRKFETPGTNTTNPDLRGNRAVYYADTLNLMGYRFFNCLTEIRDDAGYEWAPDNQVEKSAERGIRQLKRALSSFALPVLFTHETDYIYRISPENWDKQLRLVHNGIAGFNPIYLTMDEALRIVRSQFTSKLERVTYHSSEEKLMVDFSGSADSDHYIMLFTDAPGGIRQNLIKLEAYQGKITRVIEIKNIK